jgi:hypothetical protein
LLLVPIPLVDLEVDEILPMAKAHLPSLAGKRVEKRPDKLCCFTGKTRRTMFIRPPVPIPAILLMIADVHHRYYAGRPIYYVLILRVVDGEAAFAVNTPDTPVIIAADVQTWQLLDNGRRETV